jgi:hypothetical protein
MARTRSLPGLAVDLSDRRLVSPRLLAVVLLVEVLLSAVINLVVFPSAWFGTMVFGPVATVTGGLVNATLLVNLVNLAVVVVGLLVVVGGLRPRDLGLSRSKLPVAAAVTLGLWVVLQVTAAAWAYVETGSLAVDPRWSAVGVGVVLGGLLAQLLGNALYEEIVFRAVLLDQLVLRLGDRRWGFALALVGSQTVFSLLHVPNRLYQGYAPAPLVESLGLLVLMGLLFALVYHRTGNLLVAVGVHALGNAPTMLVAAPVSGHFLMVLLTVVLVAVWPALVRPARRSVGPHGTVDD